MGYMSVRRMLIFLFFVFVCFCFPFYSLASVANCSLAKGKEVNYFDNSDAQCVGRSAYEKVNVNHFCPTP